MTDYHNFTITIQDKLRRVAELDCSCGFSTRVGLQRNDLLDFVELLAAINAHLIPRISWRAA